MLFHFYSYFRFPTSTEASTLPLHHTNTSEDDCLLTKFLFVATLDLRPDPSPVQQLQEELKTKNMLIPKSQLRLGRVVGQGEMGIEKKLSLSLSFNSFQCRRIRDSVLWIHEKHSRE